MYIYIQLIVIHLNYSKMTTDPERAANSSDMDSVEDEDGTNEQSGICNKRNLRNTDAKAGFEEPTFIPSDIVFEVSILFRDSCKNSAICKNYSNIHINQIILLNSLI